MIHVNLNAEGKTKTPKTLIHSFVFSKSVKSFDCYRFPLLIYIYFTPLLDSTAANAIFTQKNLCNNCCIKAKIQCCWVRWVYRITYN